MSRRETSLRYAVRPRVVAKYTGQLLLVFAALTAVPLVAALAFGEWWQAARYGAACAAACVLGGPLARLHRPDQVRLNEAMTVTALIYLLGSGLMVFPMMGAGLPAVDAWFEAVSGITTTGLTTAGSLEGAPRSFVLGRAWMQWYGGLGIVVLSLALTVRPSVSARRLSEAAGVSDEGVVGARTVARETLVVYAGLTAAGLAVTALLGVPVLETFALTLTAVSTGGFAPSAESLAGVDGWWARGWLLLLGLGGATSFAVLIRMRREGWRAALRSRQVGAVLVASAVATALLGACFVAFEGMSWREAALHAPATALSAQTTTGYSTLDVGALDATSKLALIGSMFVGGEAGSTAGGVKILRLLILLELIRHMVVRASMPPRAVSSPRLGGRSLAPEESREAMVVIALFAMVNGAAWLAFTASGHDPVDALFDVVSATGTVGLSTGVCGPDLHWALKGALAVAMLLGRLEIVAWLVLISPGNWLSHREQRA